MEHEYSTRAAHTDTDSSSRRGGRRRRRARRASARAAARLGVAEPRKATAGSSGFSLRALLRGLDEVITRLELGARELREVTESAASVIDLGLSQLEAATVLRSRAARLHKTGTMLAQLVLGYRLFGLRTAFASRERADEVMKRLHADNAVRFRDTSREQGGAFLKVGQLLSARADLLPEVWVRELSSLQDAAPPIPPDETLVALQHALGADPERCFADFELQPLAAASIGQVHRARTFDGQQVAVKLQRPGIAARIEDDLALLDLSYEALRSSLPPLDLDTILQQIRVHVRAEVDYTREAALTSRVAAFFTAVPGLIVPEPVLELCSPELLTTHFIEGRKITSVLDELRAAGDSAAQARLSQLLGLLLQGYLRQILQLGTFQADPHPGNLLVTPADELVILDFGCAGELTEATRHAYLQLMSAFFERDRARMATAFQELGFRTQSGQPDTLVTFMETLLGELADALQHGKVSWPDRETVAARAKNLGASLTADPVTTVPDHFVMIGRVLATLSGLFSHYQPDIDVSVHVLPVLMQAYASA